MARPKTSTAKPKRGPMPVPSKEEIADLKKNGAIVGRVQHPLNPSVTATPQQAKAINKEMRALDKAMDKETDAITLEQEIAADAAAAAPAPDMLARITTNGELLLRLRKQLAELNDAAADITKSIQVMEQQTLPSLFDEAGVKVVGLDDADGHVMERDEAVFASISQVNAADAAAWLIKNGYGAIVKSKILVELEKEESKLLGIVRKALTKEHIAFQESSAVNAATLKAFVKERLAAGTVLPKSISVHVQPLVTVKVPKKRGKK